MSSKFYHTYNTIYEYRAIFIIIGIIIISKKIIFFNIIWIVMLYIKFRKKLRRSKKIPEKNIEVLKGIDRKIYVLTKCNTLVNRDLMDKRNTYLKKVKKEYNLIYGQKGNNYFNSIQQNIQRPKKNKKVSFSGEIEYSN